MVILGIKWCKKQKKGIKIIKTNENLAQEYIQASEETLSVLKTSAKKSRMWQATTKYYSEYFAAYAMLMKIGIKSEIHDCTIELAKILEKENLLPKGFSNELEQDKELRIDNQYYLKNKEADIDYDKLLTQILKIKEKISTITLEETEKIRKQIEASA